MARKAEAPCMLCGGLHAGECGSGQTKKRSSRSVKARPSTKSTPTSTSVEPAKDTEDIFGAIPTQAKPKFKSSSPLASRDLSFESALRLLRPLLSGPAQRELDRELNHPYPQDIDKRVALWKARHVRKD